MIIPLGMDIHIDFDDIDLGVMFGVLFGLLIISLIGLAIMKSSQNRKDNAQPVRSEQAKIVDRTQTTGTVILTASLTFELNNGERVKLVNNLKEREVAGLVIGDVGVLTWQGSRLLRFVREP